MQQTTRNTQRRREPTRSMQHATGNIINMQPTARQHAAGNTITMRHAADAPTCATHECSAGYSSVTLGVLSRYSRGTRGYSKGYPTRYSRGYSRGYSSGGRSVRGDRYHVGGVLRLLVFGLDLLPALQRERLVAPVRRCDRRPLRRGRLQRRRDAPSADCGRHAQSAAPICRFPLTAD